MRVRSRTLLAWSLWLGTLGCLVGGLVVTLLVTRPLTSDVLVDGRLRGRRLAAVRDHRAGPDAAAARQPDRLAVRRRRAGLVPLCPLGPMGRPAAAHRTAAAPGRPAGGPGRRQPVGGRHHPRHHPAIAAAAQRAAAVAPLAGGRRRRRGRHDHGGGRLGPVAGPDDPDPGAGGQAVRPWPRGRHGRRHDQLDRLWDAVRQHPGRGPSVWCCGSGPLAGSSASSCAGSRPGPPWPSSGRCC